MNSSPISSTLNPGSRVPLASVTSSIRRFLFANPVAQLTVKTAFREHRLKVAYTLLSGVVVVGLLLMSDYFARHGHNYSAARLLATVQGWLLGSGSLAILFGGLAAATFGSPLLASEKETGSLRLLRTTRLSPGQIVAGKIVGMWVVLSPLLVLLTVWICGVAWIWGTLFFPALLISLVVAFNLAAASAMGVASGGFSNNTKRAASSAAGITLLLGFPLVHGSSFELISGLMSSKIPWDHPRALFVVVGFFVAVSTVVAVVFAAREHLALHSQTATNLRHFGVVLLGLVGPATLTLMARGLLTSKTYGGSSRAVLTFPVMATLLFVVVVTSVLELAHVHPSRPFARRNFAVGSLVLGIGVPTVLLGLPADLLQTAANPVLVIILLIGSGLVLGAFTLLVPKGISRPGTRALLGFAGFGVATLFPYLSLLVTKIATANDHGIALFESASPIGFINAFTNVSHHMPSGNTLSLPYFLVVVVAAFAVVLLGVRRALQRTAVRVHSVRAH